MAGLMRQTALPDYTLLPENEYPGMADMITSFLRGEREQFQYSFIRQDGQEVYCFHEREQAHMADCRGLFSLCRRVMLISFLSAAVLLGAVLLIRQPSSALCGARWGIRGVAAVLLVMAAAAVIDFDAVFVLFHRLSFANDLWLMDPHTDMIIRLMPLSFFIRYAALIAGCWLVLLAGAAAILYHQSRKRGNKQ